MQHRHTNSDPARRARRTRRTRRTRAAARALPRPAGLALALLPALVVLGAVTARTPPAEGAALTPSPAALTGRLHRQAPPGGYVDHGAPLAPWEARLVAGYRTPQGD